MNRWVVLLCLVTGCQCQDARKPDAQPPARAIDGAAAVVAGDGGGDDDPGEAPVGPTGPDVADELPDPGAQIEALGAIPAWQVVVDRDSYLARREQHGVVYGVIGDAVPQVELSVVGAGPDAGTIVAQPADLVWLLDDTEGAGALGVRVKLPATPPVVAGARVAVRGAWKVDDARRWYWDGTEVVSLKGEPMKVGAGPSHAVAAADPPGGWSRVRTPDKAVEGDLVAFTVREKPVREGDGWAASNERWGEIVAYIRLPGERPSYGGHDLRADDERWALKKGGTYWVQAGKIRRREGQVPVIEAVTPPVRFP
jgi:hypothetical protein